MPFHMGAFEANLYSTESHFQYSDRNNRVINLYYLLHLVAWRSDIVQDNVTENLRWPVNRLFKNKPFQFRTTFKKNKSVLNVFKGQLKNLKIFRTVLAEEIIKFSKQLPEPLIYVCHLTFFSYCQNLLSMFLNFLLVWR